MLLFVDAETLFNAEVVGICVILILYFTCLTRVVRYHYNIESEIYR
jgi:hypothetical protein